MSWRGSIDIKDRILSVLIYPIVVIFTRGLGLIGLVIFFALFAGVVRNPQVSHFLRYNTMQAILIDILFILYGMVLNLLLPLLGGSILSQILVTIGFFAPLGACLYSMVQSGLGRYAEIPTISDAAYSQVR